VRVTGSMSPRGPFGIPRRAVLSALLLTSCVYREDAGNHDHVDDPTLVYEECVEGLDQLPARDVQRAFEDAAKRLETQGTSLAEAWTDPDRFLELHTEARRAAGCEPISETPGKAPSALHADHGPDNYCGPGHRAQSFLNPNVSSCLNEACRVHDACYAGCSRKTGLGCMWGSETEACDREMLRSADACEHDDHEFASRGVIWLAHSLDAIGPNFTCQAGMVCPGVGPCRTNPEGGGCIWCLALQDPNAACLARACNAAIEELCYLSNCPDVGQCFGDDSLPDSSSGGSGGSDGVGGAPSEPLGGAGGSLDGGMGGQSFDPQTLWVFSIAAAELPPAKPDGLAWDAGDTFEAPDPFVRARVGRPDAAAHDSTSPEDNFFPTWVPPQELVAATASEFLTYINVEVWDEDLVVHDFAGACTLQLSTEQLGAGLQNFTCSGERDELLFRLTVRIDGAQ
jgi:hypothetical protein